MNKVAVEKGLRLDPHDDPIHDQSTYMDTKLRRRLYQEYGVRGIFFFVKGVWKLLVFFFGLPF